MQKLIPFVLLSISLFSCKENKENSTSATSRKNNTTIPSSPPPIKDSLVTQGHPFKDSVKKKTGIHPVSLHWISWEKKGTATIKPMENGWYEISGRQLNEEGDYLNIKGKIRRLSPKELEFDGTIETKVKMNNGGELCLKKGLQKFYGKGTRTYYRLQNMENCEGGNLVDYIDIFPGTSSL